MGIPSWWILGFSQKTLEPLELSRRRPENELAPGCSSLTQGAGVVPVYGYDSSRKGWLRAVYGGPEFRFGAAGMRALFLAQEPSVRGSSCLCKVSSIFCAVSIPRVFNF
jgi:hypothetical protein